MKRIILLICALFISVAAHCQEDDNTQYGRGAVPFVDGKPLFSIIENLEGRTADQLYAQAKLAIAEMFKSAQNVIQLDDPTNRIIVAKGNYKIDETIVLTKSTTYVFFTMKIACKDGRYKVDLTDFNNSIRLGNDAPVEIAGVNLTDENCINKKGECKTTGYGFHRRRVIDTKDLIFAEVKEKMESNALTTSEDW